MRTSSTRKPKKRGARRSHAAKPLRYFCAAILITVVLMVLRGAIAWAAEYFIYTLPLLGGLLKSLELMEVSNVILFAILGVSLGAITLWLPPKTNNFVKAIAPMLAIPIVFLSGYAVRHYVWVEQVAVQSELLPAQAQQITDSLLTQATGRAGLLGFFQYSVQVPILPTDLSALRTVNEDDKWFRSELTRYSGLEPGIFTLLFTITGWGIRLFYTLLALVTAIIYFAKGLVWAENHRHPQP